MAQLTCWLSTPLNVQYISVNKVLERVGPGPRHSLARRGRSEQISEQAFRSHAPSLEHVPLNMQEGPGWGQRWKSVLIPKRAALSAAAQFGDDRLLAGKCKWHFSLMNPLELSCMSMSRSQRSWVSGSLVGWAYCISGYCIFCGISPDFLHSLARGVTNSNSTFFFLFIMYFLVPMTYTPEWLIVQKRCLLWSDWDINSENKLLFDCCWINRGKRIYCHIIFQMSFHSQSPNLHSFFMLTALRPTLCQAVVQYISLYSILYVYLCEKCNSIQMKFEFGILNCPGTCRRCWSKQPKHFYKL